MAEHQEQRSWSVIRWWTVTVLGLLALAYLLAVPLGLVGPEERLSTAEVILGGALLAALAFADRLDEIKFGSLALNLRRVEERQTKLESEVEAFSDRVTALFLNTMAPSMYDNLVALSGGGRPYSQDHREDLIREVTLLRDLGYVDDFNRHEIEPSGDLAHQVHVTERGREFIELRRELDSSQR